MIQFDHVEKKLGNFQMSDLSFSVPKGYILGLIGQNGAGKTTLLHLLMGLYRADSGKILVFGADPKKEEEKVRAQIGWVLSEEVFSPVQTLEKTADRYGKYYSDYNREVFSYYCTRFGLKKECALGKLSKGEKLKFQFAFALSHAPKLLVLDEPTANFDPEFREEFFHLITDFISDGEKGIILATHLTTDLDRIADYIAMLDNGKLVFCTEREILTDSYRILCGEAYKLRLIPKEKIIAMEEKNYGARALVKHNKHSLYDSELRVNIPTLEEIMFFHALKTHSLKKNSAAGDYAQKN